MARARKPAAKAAETPKPGGKAPAAGGPPEETRPTGSGADGATPPPDTQGPGSAPHADGQPPAGSGDAPAPEVTAPPAAKGEDVVPDAPQRGVWITSKVKTGFRRCGIRHPAERLFFPEGYWSDDDLKILRAEPNLLVEEV